MAETPPNKIVIDFLEGVTSRIDAVSYARGFISSHFDVPEQSGYFVMPFKGGFAFEVQEGGSQRAFLPAILRTLEESPLTTVSVRSGSRVLQVSKGARDNFNAVLLPEELSSYLENVIELDEKSPRLLPYQVDNLIWVLWGGVAVVTGLLLLMVALAVFLATPPPHKPLVVITTPPDKLPIAQWPEMVKKLDGTNYISEMKYENGAWTFAVLPNDTGKSAAAHAAPAASAAAPSGPIVMPAVGAEGGNPPPPKPGETPPPTPPSSSPDNKVPEKLPEKLP